MNILLSTQLQSRHCQTLLRGRQGPKENQWEKPLELVYHDIHI